MDSSDEDTFDESNAEEEEEDDDIDEIFEDDEDDEDLGNQSSMSLDQDDQVQEVQFMEENWPPQNISMPVPDKASKKKPGIIYLSSIPPGFNVTSSIAFFSQFGKVGRVFLQPDVREKSKRKDKLARHFTEGWIEFQSKRVAKEVASNLNNTAVGGKKRSKAHDVLWNIKYLPKFKWTNLSDRLAYEKAVHNQRLRTEISQAKREADFFKANVEKSKRLARKRAREPTEPDAPPSPTKKVYDFRQKETDSSIRKKSQQQQQQQQQKNN